MSESAMACSSQVDPAYTSQLKRSIEEKFAFYFRPPDALLIYFYKFDVNVLTDRDADCVKAVTKSNGEHDGAVKLLELLCLRKDWFPCLLQVLRDPDVKLSHVADDFEKTKERIDNNRDEEEKKWKEKHEELKEQLLLKGKVERRFKKELKKKDQLIAGLTKTLKQKEIQSLHHERNAQLDSMQKQVSTQEASALQVVFGPSRSESVTLFNSCMTFWIHKETPDFAKTYGIPRCDVPADLKIVAAFVTRYRVFFHFDAKPDITFIKNEVTSYLQVIQDAVNRLRDKGFSDDDLKRILLGLVACFFSLCYCILTTFERQQTKELCHILMFCRESIIDMLDSLVDELGGWVQISSSLQDNKFRLMTEAFAKRWIERWIENRQNSDLITQTSS